MSNVYAPTTFALEWWSNEEKELLGYIGELYFDKDIVIIKTKNGHTITLGTIDNITPEMKLAITKIKLLE